MLSLLSFTKQKESRVIVNMVTERARIKNYFIDSTLTSNTIGVFFGTRSTNPFDP